MRTVAEAAEVSTATVSQVLNGRTDTASAATRERILRVAEELGYRINRSARAMRTGRSGLALLSLTMLADPWSQEVAQVVAARLRQEDVQALVLPDGDWLDVLQQRDFDVAFVDDVEPQQLEGLAGLVAGGGRLVAMGPQVKHPDGVDFVDSPSSDGCRAAVEHLIELGHERIHCLTGTYEGQLSRRGQIWRQVMTDAGLPCGDDMVFTFGYDRNEAMTQALHSLRSPERPTALYCTTDFAAIAAVHAAALLQIDVPGELSIMGAGNTAEGRHLVPGLSTVGPVGFAERLAEVVIDRLHDRRPPALHHFEWQIITRGTTAAAPQPE